MIDPPAEPPSEATFTCPICLGENQAVDADDVGDDPPAEQGENPAFQLTACNHWFCAACLRAYVRSKLMDGEASVRCCHFKVSSLEEEDFHPCDVLINEADIYDLLHAHEGTAQSTAGDWCCGDDEDDIGNSLFDSWVKSNIEKNMGGEKLWAKYQKLKFDQYHGKDVVRRCPKCDDAHLFDAIKMREYQASFLCHNISAAESSDSTRNASRMGRAFDTFRQRQRDAANEKKSAPSEKACDEKKKPTIEGESSKGAGTIPDEEVAGGSAECKTPESSQGETERSESPPTLAKTKTPTVNCKSCGTEFCYFHSNAHSGKSCIEYHKKAAEQEKSNVDYASRILRAKPCPTCGIAVSKEGGCNQIKCGSCGSCFCWLCGKVVDDGAFPEHFRWWNLRGCANMQLDENTEPMTCTIWGAKLLSVLQILVLGVPALVLTLLTVVMCPCLVPGCGNTNRERVVNTVSFWGSFMSSMLLLPFTCLGMLILSVLYFFLAAIAFCMKLVKSLTGKNGTPSNAVSSAIGSDNPARDADAVRSDSRNAYTRDDFIRELETIFEMEEGRSSMDEGVAASSEVILNDMVNART